MGMSGMPQRCSCFWMRFLACAIHARARRTIGVCSEARCTSSSNDTPLMFRSMLKPRACKMATSGSKLPGSTMPAAARLDTKGALLPRPPVAV
eukprot:2333210-Lingulodinium_polyedra.AAC.1